MMIDCEQASITISTPPPSMGQVEGIGECVAAPKKKRKSDCADPTDRKPPTFIFIHMLLLALLGLTTPALSFTPSTAVLQRQTPPRAVVRADASLVGTTYALEMDIGQERGSWMPPKWGRSGARATPTATVLFCDDGVLKVTETGYFDGNMVEFEPEGEWSVENGKATFALVHGGLSRNDVMLEPGRLYFNAPCWGAQLGRRGGLTIRQRKMGFLPFLPTLTPASFIVGTFRAAAKAATEE